MSRALLDLATGGTPLVAEHERLLEDIRDLMDQYEDGEVVDVDAFAVRLDAWFSTHFRTRDARLHRRLG